MLRRGICPGQSSAAKPYRSAFFGNRITPPSGKLSFIHDRIFARVYVSRWIGRKYKLSQVEKSPGKSVRRLGGNRRPTKRYLPYGQPRGLEYHRTNSPDLI